MDHNKIAIVTGAGSGIGRAVAIALFSEGWSVVLAGSREQQLEETANACNHVQIARASNQVETTNADDQAELPTASNQAEAPKADNVQRILVVPTDINIEESVQYLFSETLKTFGRLDLLFNNAGINVAAKPFEQLTLQEWQSVINTNVTGAFLCAREAFRIMKQQQPTGGRIINNGSISAHVPRPNSAPYTASKHAITGLTRSISLDGRAFNIACGQIDIGNASSEMTKTIEEGALQADGSRKIEPTIRVEDVGRAVVYMASLPHDTNIPFLTIMANQMPYMGRG